MVYLVIILSITWILLSGYFTVLPLVPGIISIFVIVWLYTRALKSSKNNNKRAIPLIRILRYLPFLIKEIVLSNIFVIRTILGGTYVSIIIRVSNPFQTESGIILFTNSIILTPGTITMYYQNDEFLIHMLHAPYGDNITDSEMIQRIKALEEG